MRRLEVRRTILHLINTVNEHKRDRNKPKVNPDKARKIKEVPKRKRGGG